MRLSHTLTVAALMLTATFGTRAADAHVRLPGWLTGAEDDQTRFDLLQQQLRGFETAMGEVGARFQSLHAALSRDNFDLARYQWEKIRATIQSGYLKRPKRKASAEAIFLGTSWEQVREAIVSQDRTRAWAGFEQARGACMACHQAEGVPFMNNQPVFDFSAPPKASE